jgi:hypothetical protein
MNCPSVSSMIGHNIFMLFGLLTALAMGLAFSVWRARRQPKELDSRTRLVMACVGVVATLWLCCGCLSGIPGIITDLSFRGMNPGKVTSLEVTPVRGEQGRPQTSKRVTIQDRGSIAHGLELLEDNHPYSMNHEHFTESYLVTANTPERVYSFYVFTKSQGFSGDNDRTVVKLILKPNPEFQLEGGTYSCPDFVEWLQKELAARR